MSKSLRPQSTEWHCYHPHAVQRTMSGLESCVTLSPLGFYCSSNQNVGSGGGGEGLASDLPDHSANSTQEPGCRQDCLSLGDLAESWSPFACRWLYRARPPSKAPLPEILQWKDVQPAQTEPREASPSGQSALPPALRQLDIDIPSCWELTVTATGKRVFFFFKALLCILQ